jgi:hypothetical protein
MVVLNNDLGCVNAGVLVDIVVFDGLL